MNLTPFHIISLRQYPNRTERVKELLDHVGLEYRIHLFDAITPGWKGCLNSHLSLVRYAKENSLPFITVLEDNVEMIRSLDENVYRNLETFIRYSKEWDIVYIGGFITPFQTCEYYRKQIYRTKRCHGTSAYVMSERFYDKLLESRLDEPIDIVYSKTAKQFIYEPLLFYRKHNLDSIVEPRFNFIRKLYFYPNVHKVIEWLFFQGWLKEITYSVVVIICILVVRIVKRNYFL